MKKFLIAIALCCSMASCIKDEAPNKECDIESAWIEGAEYEDLFYQTTEMRKENISSGDTYIIFTVKSMLSLPSQIPVNFKITEGATIEPASGQPQDFTKGPLVYTVTSQDGQWERTYNVLFREAAMPVQLFSFENVEVRTETTILGAENQMDVFYEILPPSEGGTEQDYKKYCWASGNAGAAILKSGAKPEDFPTYSIPDGKEGKAVCLTTQGTGALGQLFKKPIAAGNLFLGEFVVEYVSSDPLKSTLFGVPNPKEPVRITGWYKYKRGEKFTDMDMKEYTDRQDEASIYAVYYRNCDEQGERYVLDGYAVADLDKLTDNPQIYKVARVASLPPTDTWQQWEMFFEGKDVPDDLVATNGFNLALVFSSSINGAQFEGAVGSTLCIDEVEVFYEK